jgi:predicted RND superfamily exporter protein
VVLTTKNISEAFVNDINTDLVIIGLATIVMVVYSLIVLSSCTPVHLRIWVTLTGLATIFMSYASAFSICGLFGWQTSYLHNLLAFTLLCIGVDDMYIMSITLD